MPVQLDAINDAFVEARDEIEYAQEVQTIFHRARRLPSSLKSQPRNCASDSEWHYVLQSKSCS